MDRARIAAELRALADAIEAEGEAEESKKRRKRARSFPAPLREPSELDRMRARKMLRRRGIQA